MIRQEEFTARFRLTRLRASAEDQILEVASRDPREAKFYALTRAGEKQLEIEKQSWDRLAAAVRLIFAQGE